MSKYNVNIQECAVGDNSKLTIGATDGVPRQVPTLKQGARTKPSWTPPPPSVPEGVQENLHLTEVQKQWLLTSLALENLFLPRIRKLILEEIEKENIKGEMDKSQTDFLLGRVYTLYHRPLLSWIADCDKLSELEVFRFFNHIGLTKKKWYSCSSLQLDSLLSRVEARHFHDDLRWPLSLFLKQIRLPAADIEELLEDLDNFNARGLDLLVNISGPAELMKLIQQPHDEVMKRSSEVQASREKFGKVSEREKLVGQQDIQPERELTKSTSKESEGTLSPSSVPEGVRENLYLTEVQKQWLLTSLALENLVLPRIRKLMVEEIKKENIKRKMDNPLEGFYSSFPDTFLSSITDCDELSGPEGIRFLIQRGFLEHASVFAGHWERFISPREARRLHEELRRFLSSFLEGVISAADIRDFLEELDNFEARGLDLLRNISGPAELMKRIQQPHGEVKKRSSEVQTPSEKFGNVSETEKLVGQPESELLKSTSKESEEAQQQQQQQYHDIIEKTKHFEALHKECIRVLPYADKLSGQVYVQLYVICGNNGIPAELNIAARNCFQETGVKLKWTDLYNEASDVPKITRRVSRRLEKFEVDEIWKIIDTSQLTFNKHRNITAVYPSLKVTDSKRTNEPCIMVNVIGKGRIPIGETNIPAFIERFPVDIVEGFSMERETPSKPMEPQEEREYLRLGASIGTKGVVDGGTLGAILKDNDEAEKLVGQQDIQSQSEMTKGVSKEREEAEKLVGQQNTQPEGELTKGAFKKTEEDYQDIIEKTKNFEALHKECIRVLPYRNKLSGQVYVQLYVFCGNNGIPKVLSEAAGNCFGKMGVKLKWTDLCNETSDVPNITPGVSRRLQKSEVDEISKIIDTSLLIFNKHRNITAVYPSLKITDSKRTNEPCIMVNVIGKGRIPIGESNIPEFVDSYPVDIVEGFWIETVNPSNPIEPKERREYLRLGASISLKGVPYAGTLGAFVKDDDDKFYLLSCNHVIGDREKKEILHPGWLQYVESFKYCLDEYNKLLKRVTKTETGFSTRNWQPTELSELKNAFRGLQRISDCNNDKLPSSVKKSGCYKDFIDYAQQLEELVNHSPRVVADFSRAFSGNVHMNSNLSKKEISIDAAVAELREEEVNALKQNFFVEMIGTANYPSGTVLASDEVLIHPHAREWCKSGSITEHTSINTSTDLRLINLKVPLSEQVLHFDFDTKKVVVTEPESVGWRKNFVLENVVDEPFSRLGDSGAVIFEKREDQESMSAFGMVVGVHYENNTLHSTIVSPLDDSLRILSYFHGKNLTMVPSIFE
ncbi:uncharacterized protein LOC111344598 isoform X2 [Stylophora pistillata]|uniref:uncharacterized protein LOC111344598 isoform X2 n=1 Tax=Stylophora pistillata TaxID=50429 RepID=UPI000C0465EB|nr:uncharacterized protein LOC111344598 isoform X2 [Stylophora pistillata]